MPGTDLVMQIEWRGRKYESRATELQGGTSWGVSLISHKPGCKLRVHCEAAELQAGLDVELAEENDNS